MSSIRIILPFVALVVIAFAQAYGRSEADYESHVVNFSQVVSAGKGFSWKDCGSGAAGSISKLSLTPDPLEYPGSVTASFEATLNRDANGPIKAVVHMEKLDRFGAKYIRVPCFQNMGSCTYNDICPMLQQFTCDANDASNLNCHCPFKKGSYSMAPSTFPIKVKESVPGSAVRGDYKFNVNLSDSVGQVMCLQGHFVIV